MRYLIRLGDPTSHGGVVASASPTASAIGKAIARVGDQVVCPRTGHALAVIVEGDPNWLVDGRPVALEGHLTSCGASLIATQAVIGRQ